MGRDYNELCAGEAEREREASGVRELNELCAGQGEGMVGGGGELWWEFDREGR